jgi:hypothetical protein
MYTLRWSTFQGVETVEQIEGYDALLERLNFLNMNSMFQVAIYDLQR